MTDPDARPAPTIGALARAALGRVDPRFWRFLGVGIVNTAFGYSLFLVLAHSPLPLFAAVALANAGGIAFNFFTTGSLVFGDRDARKALRFVAGYAVHSLVNYGALRALLALGVPLVWASAMLLPPMAVFSFLVNRRFVFGAKRAPG